MFYFGDMYSFALGDPIRRQVHGMPENKEIRYRKIAGAPDAKQYTMTVVQGISPGHSPTAGRGSRGCLALGRLCVRQWEIKTNHVQSQETG